MLADLPKPTTLSPWGEQGGLGEPRAWPRAAPRQRGTPCGVRRSPPLPRFARGRGHQGLGGPLKGARRPAAYSPRLWL